MFFTIALSTLVVFIGLILWSRHGKNKKRGIRLRGPFPLPVLGNILSLGFRPHVTFAKWAKRYGPIYKIKLGLQDAIIVNDHKLIKELFNESASSGRMGDNPVVMEFTKGPHGIINSSAKTWESQRKFTVRTLRNLGFAKTSMETLIMDEVLTMLDWFKKREGSPISAARIFNAPVVNSLWRMVTGERCKWEESRSPIFDAMDEFFKATMAVSTNGLLFAPILRFIAPNYFGWNRYVASVNTMINYFNESIRKHKETFDSLNLRDYIDQHMLESGNETDPKSSFYKQTGNANLVAVVFDLFFAGSETSANSLAWTMLYLSEHQEIQKRLQKEIDNVVGSRMPSTLDRENMPYSEAVISEILRITSVLPCGAPHEMTSDLIFHGYHLPNTAAVFANLYGVHHDPEIWVDPENFRPERFLSEDGTKFVQNDALIPFAEGKRKCIGEAFGKDSLLLFVTSICQKFNILPDPEKQEKADYDPDFGLILGPKPFNVIVSSRSIQSF